VKIEALIVAALASLILWAAIFLVWTLYQHSQIEPPTPPCRTEQGHDRPQSFCDERDSQVQQP
jgi:hypothetical protein